MNTERPDHDDAGASGRDPEEARTEQGAESATDSTDSAGTDEAAEAREPVAEKAEKAPDAEKGEPGPEPEPGQAPGTAGAPERASDAGAGSGLVSGGAGEPERASDAEAGPERTPEAAAESELASDAGAAPERTPDMAAGPKPASGTEAGPERTPEAAAESELASDAGAAPERTPDMAAGPKPASGTEAGPERTPDTTAGPKPASGTEAAPERTPDTTAGPKPASGTEAAPERTPDAAAAPERTPDAAAGPKPAAGAEAGPEQVNDAAAESELDSDTAADPEPAPETQAGPEPAPDTAAGPEPASGAVHEAGARRGGSGGGRHGGRHGGPEDAHDGPRRRSPAIIASVAAAVLLVGGGGAYLAANASGGSGGDTPSGAAGDDTPPPLRLDGYSESGGGTNGIAPGEPNPYGVTYKADGDLPDGPGSAPVYRAGGEVGAAEVARLAEALGVDGKPVAQGQTWRVGADDGAGPSLQVNKQAPGTWTFYRYAAGTDDCRSTTVCAKTPADPSGDPVSEAVARKAAAPVLKAVGQDDAKLDASQVMGAQRVVNASPVVDGLPTYGWTTGVTVNAQGEVVGGSGQLKAPVKGDTYPVLDAEKTLGLMNAAPGTDHRMGIGGCASPVPLKDRLEAPCGDQASTGAEISPDTAASASAPPREVITVEKAVFGLAAHYVNARQALVPSWLFEVKARGAQDSFTVTHPAVDPKYLAPSTPPGEPTDQPSPRPTGPKDEPTSSPITENVPVDAYTADGKELTVAFTGGVCSKYEVTANESGDRVAVRVTSTTEQGKICIQIAKVFHRTVQLDEPLGEREVVGSDGRQVPLEKPGTRLPDEPQTSGAR